MRPQYLTPGLPGFMTPDVAAQQTSSLLSTARLLAIEARGHSSRSVIAVCLGATSLQGGAASSVENDLLVVPKAGCGTPWINGAAMDYIGNDRVLWYVPLHGFRLTNSALQFGEVIEMIHIAGYPIELPPRWAADIRGANRLAFDKQYVADQAPKPLPPKDRRQVQVIHGFFHFEERSTLSSVSSDPQIEAWQQRVDGLRNGITAENARLARERAAIEEEERRKQQYYAPRLGGWG